MLSYLIESHENVVQHEQLLAEMYLKPLRFRVTRTSSCSKQVAWRDCFICLLESSPSLIYQWDMATWHLVWDNLKSHLWHNALHSFPKLGRFTIKMNWRLTLIPNRGTCLIGIYALELLGPILSYPPWQICSTCRGRQERCQASVWPKGRWEVWSNDSGWFSKKTKKQNFCQSIW